MDDNSQQNILPAQNPTAIQPQQPSSPNIRHSKKLQLLFVLVLIVVAGADYSIYVWQHSKIKSLSENQIQLNSKAASVKQRTAEITNQNNGVVSSSQNTSSNTVSLASNQVSFTLPSGWVTATASNYAAQCYNGYYASTVSCLDTTVIVPKSLNSNSGSSSYGGINISVYKHSDSTTAQDWYWNDLLGGLAPQSSDVTSTNSINGYSTYYLNQGNESLTYGSQSNDEYYVLTNSSYVVVVTSNVNNNNGPNGTTKTNDNSQYSTTVKSFVQSIKIQGS